MKHDERKPSKPTVTDGNGNVKSEPPRADAPSTEASPAPKQIAPLPETASLRDVIAKVNELVEARAARARDRGPDSTREMTEEDARRVMLGDLKEASHTKAANALGLSYGQVYSARKGYTFKTVYKESAKSW